MIENDEIRTQVAAKSVDTLFANVDVEAAIAERLPPDLKGLAPVLAGVAQSGADDAANAALERPRVQTVWVEVSTRAQRQLVRLLDDDTTFIQTEGGAVVLDLRPLVIQIGDQVAVIGKIAEKLPESSGKVVIMQKSQLDDGAEGDEGAARRRRLDVARRARVSPRSRSGWQRGAAGSSCAPSRSASSSSVSCFWPSAASPATTSSTHS